MRRLLVSVLMPILVLLALTAVSPTASAHMGESHAGAAAGGESATGVSVVAAHPGSAADTGRSCDCPGERCTCSIDCIAFCSAMVAIAGEPSLAVSPSRAIFAPAAAEIGMSWSPVQDPDPPRSIA